MIEVSRNDYRRSIVNVVNVEAVHPWTMKNSKAGLAAIVGRYETQGT